MLFGNSNLVLKLQFRCVGLLVKVSVFSGIGCYYCFYYSDSYYKHCFLLDEIFYVFGKARAVFVISS